MRCGYRLAAVVGLSLSGAVGTGSNYQCGADEPPATHDLAARIVERAPVFGGVDYKCGDMVWVVNELRKAGKDEAIRALREFAKLTLVGDHKPQRNALFLICRCLFDKPGGWPPPVLGKPVPD